MFRKITLSTLLVALTGCSYIYGDKGFIKNRDKAYLAARTTPPLMIPPGMSSSTIQEHYPIADKRYTNTTTQLDLTPPELYAPRPAVAPQPQSETRVAQPVVAQAVPQQQASNTAPQHKQRYLMDMFTHPEYVTQSLVPNQKTTTSAATSTTTNAATSTKTSATTNSTTTPSTTQTVAAAGSTTSAAAQPKKKYIADYFR
jgi:hypothetical protein